MAEINDLGWHQVPVEVRERYILTGYRPLAYGLKSTLLSVFRLHNETLNVWTHLLPLFYFIYVLFVDDHFWNWTNLPREQRFAFGIYILGVCSLFAASSFAHLLNCVNPKWRDVCFMFDYAAISVYGVATAIAYYFYNKPRKDSILVHEEWFLLFTLMASTFATWACCWTRLNHTRFCHVIRTGSFALPFLVGSSPALVRCFGTGLFCGTEITAGVEKETYNSSVLQSADISEIPLSFCSGYTRHLVLMVGAALVNVSKVPERWYPGTFDLVGHSHQVFHILIFLSINQQFWVFAADLSRRNANGQRIPTTMSPFKAVGAFALNVVTVLILISWFSAQLKHRKPKVTNLCNCRDDAQLDTSNQKCDRCPLTRATAPCMEPNSSKVHED